MPGKEYFDSVIDAKPVSLFKLGNRLNTELCLTNYGSRIVNLTVYDKKNNPVDVVLGFDSIEDYLHTREVYHGATIGRYSNRIARGHFHLKKKEYQLAINNPPNHLHGGPNGFHSKVWDITEQNEDSITFAYLSPNGEEGYPGNLKMETRFTLSEQNEVIIDYTATTDQSTIVNVTNHAYFNLNGKESGTILRHLLQINAAEYLPIDENLIPLGTPEAVQLTPFDFTMPATIGKRINDKNIQLQYGNGYDHTYIVNKNGEQPALAAKVIGDITGVVMEVFTDQPGIQFYTNNATPKNAMIHGPIPGEFRTAFCLETQHFPDSPHHFNFPTTILNPGDIFRSTTIYKFSNRS